MSDIRFGEIYGGGWVTCYITRTREEYDQMCGGRPNPTFTFEVLNRGRRKLFTGIRPVSIGADVVLFRLVDTDWQAAGSA